MASRPVVVIIDDEPDLAASLLEVLKLELDYEVMAATSPEDGLAILKSLEETPPDLLVVDYRMPRINGAEFLVRARALFPDVPAIMVTAYADLDLVLRAARDLRVAKFMRKPLRAAEVVAAVRDIVTPGWVARQRNTAFQRSARGP